MAFTDKDIRELWEQAVAAGNQREGAGDGGEINHIFNKLLKKGKNRDGVPLTVANELWEKAIRSRPAPKRGPNTAAQVEYRKLCDGWIAKQKAKIERLGKRKAEKIQAAIEVGQMATSSPKDLALSIEEELTIEARDVLDDWESILDSAAECKDITKYVRQLNIADKPTYTAEVPHGHPMLAKSRSFADSWLRNLGMARMIAAQATVPGWSRSVVFDVGSGTAGIKASWKRIASVEGANKIFWHCTFPVLEGDLSRDYALIGASLNAGPLIDHVNWIEMTGTPMLGVVNVCRHRASECNCLALYNTRFVMSVHSSYYFSDSDWAQLFKYTETVHTAEHLPEKLGVGVPSADPEFRWMEAKFSQAIPWWRRAISAIREHVTGQVDLVFEPLRPHGTVYTQRDPRADIQRGGFHMLPDSTRWLRDKLQSDAGVLVQGLGSQGGMLLTGVTVAKCLMERRLPSLKEVARVGTLLAPALAFKALERVRECPMPAPTCQYTVNVTPGRQLSYHGEPCVHFFTYRRAPLKHLSRNLLCNNVANQMAAREAAATMLLSKKSPEVTESVVAARCLREGMSPHQTKQTMNRATQIVAELNCQPQAQSSSTQTQESQGPFCALGAISRLKQGGGLTSMLMLGFACTIMLRGFVIVRVYHKLWTDLARQCLVRARRRAKEVLKLSDGYLPIPRQLLLAREWQSMPWYTDTLLPPGTH